jgi:uncharacterized protein DUF3854
MIPKNFEPPPQSPSEAALSPKHRKMLVEGSAIAPGIVAERGTFTVRRGKDVPQNHGGLPKKPGIVFPVHTLEGGIFYRLRPDNPGRLSRYMQPKGHPNRLDVHPRQHERIKQPGGMRYITEGEKKVDAGVSRGLLMVGLSGVWNGQKDKALIPDWRLLPLQGEHYSITFDSDIETNESVQMAADRQARLLREAGAEVFITLLPPAADGSKQGLDDFFANEGSAAELELLTQPYKLETVERVRLTRDEKLRAATDDLERRYSDMPVVRIGQCSDRASFRALIRRARRSGNATEDGVEVRASIRRLATETRLGTESQRKSLMRLERDGYLRRIEEPKWKVEKQGAAYLLYAACTERALGRQDGKKRAQQNETQEQQGGRGTHRYKENAQGVYLTRAPDVVPELRHSKCVHTWGRREGRRVVVDTEFVYRLAKPRQEIVMYLFDRGGEAHEDELLGRFGSPRTRLRDFRKRRIAPLTGSRYARDKETGQERRLEVGPPLVACEGGLVRLLPEWREALEEHRVQTDEPGDNRRQAENYRRQGRAYRNRDKTPADVQTSPLRGKAAMARLIEERRREDKERWVEEQRTKVGETAATFIADELQRAQAVRFQDVRERYAARGGRAEELRKAVLYGPWCFKRESDGDLYIYREATAGDHSPEPRKKKPEPDQGRRIDRLVREGMAEDWARREVLQEKPEDPPEDDWRSHPLACECPACTASMPRYATAWGRHE